MSGHEGLTETAKDVFGGISFGGIGKTLSILFLILVVTVVSGIIVYVFLMSRRYNKKITIFENVAGQGTIPVGSDKAMSVKVGDGGEEILFLRKRKVYRTAYGKKIGKNHFAFAIGKDGYWYNVTFGDLDKTLLQLGITPIDRDMRYMHVAIRRLIKERYERTTFLQKYGGLIAYISLIAITGVMMWLLFDKFLDITGSINGAIEASEKVLDATRNILVANDNILSGASSGIVPA